MQITPIAIITSKVGILAIIKGCYSILTREARVPGDNDKQRVVEGFPAILVVMAEQVDALRQWAASQTVSAD